MERKKVESVKTHLELKEWLVVSADTFKPFKSFDDEHKQDALEYYNKMEEEGHNLLFVHNPKETK